MRGRWFCAVLAVVCGCAGAAEKASTKARVDQAWQYMIDEMDRWASGPVVYDSSSSVASEFYPSNWLGDTADLTFEPRFMADRPCIRITCAMSGGEGWSGICWVYPDHPSGNWGDAGPGQDLRGATRVRFKIKSDQEGSSVEIAIGGVNRGIHADTGKRHADSLEEVKQTFALTRQWEEHEIQIPNGADLSSVLGGFSIYFSRPLCPNGKVTVYLDDVRYDKPRPEHLRLIRSYTPLPDASDDWIRNAAYLYDNDLALLALLARGDKDSLRRAKILADAIVAAQENDRFYNDGRWRNAYACGPLIDYATKKARVPAIYDPDLKKMKEDRYAISAFDTGNVAWTICALLSAHDRLNAGRRYLDAAIRAAERIEKDCRVDDPLGGCSGGYEGWEQSDDHPKGPDKLSWRSSEHNIDVYVGFLKISRALQKLGAKDADMWEQRAMHARKFILSMWSKDEQHFWMGTRDEKGTLNTDTVPMDVQTWALLAMGHDPEFRRATGWTDSGTIPAFLEWAVEHCREQSGPFSGYKFSTKGTGIWPEGMGHLAAAWKYLNQPKRAEAVLDEILRLKPAIPLPPGSSKAAADTIWAAHPKEAFTGIRKVFYGDRDDPWIYPARPHLGATAWFLLAVQGANPYWLEGPPEK